MTDIPTVEQHRLNSFEERLRQVQADVTGLQISHRELRSEMKKRFDILDTRFDTLELRLETMITEMRRFFNRYEHIDFSRYEHIDTERS